MNNKTKKRLKIVPINNHAEYLVEGDIVEPSKFSGNDVLQVGEEAKITHIYQITEIAKNGEIVISHYINLEITKESWRTEGQVGKKMTTHTIHSLTRVAGRRTFEDLKIII